MANQGRLYLTGWSNGLKRLRSVREPLARRMAVEGGKLLQNAAKMYCPVSDASVQSKYPAGNLRDSIYLARDTDRTTDTQFVYKISWNATKAWYGHLIEFGHWYPYIVHVSVNGKFYTDKKMKDMRNGGKGNRFKAVGFLRRAGDNHSAEALRAMLARGRMELPILLGGS